MTALQTDQCDLTAYVSKVWDTNILQFCVQGWSTTVHGRACHADQPVRRRYLRIVPYPFQFRILLVLVTWMMMRELWTQAVNFAFRLHLWRLIQV